MPRHRLCAAVVFVLFLFILLVPATTHGTPAAHLLITEVMYDPAAPEPGAEWIELYNPTGAAQSLSGWALRDNSSTDALPDFTLEPGQYLVVAANRDEFLAANPGYGGALIALGSPIGNGLSNSGDSLALLDAGGSAVDGISYGGDVTILNPPCPDVDEGQALARYPSDADTDAASDWITGAATPGGPSAPPPPPPTATDTPTATPSVTASTTPTVTRTPSSTPTPSVTPNPDDPTSTPTETVTPASWPRLLLSEVYYDAPQTGSEGKYEWVELYNPTERAVSLEGWQVADNSAADSLPQAEIPAGGFLVVAATTDGFATNFPQFSGALISIEGSIGNGLSNSGDRLRLIAPDETVIDEMSYGDDKSVFDPPCSLVKAGESLARVPARADTDRAADWIAQAEPNPGAEGVPPTPTPTFTSSATATATRTGAPTATPTVTKGPTPTRTPAYTRTPTPTRTPTNTRTPTRTPSPTPSVTPTPGGKWPTILLSEVMYDPAEEGSDADWEWVELYNQTAERVTLSGWSLADSFSRDRLPDVALEAGEYLVVAAKEAAFRASHPDFTGRLLPLEGSIGNGLSNTGDSVKLLAPDGGAVDAMSYGSDKSVFDPACKDVKAGQSLGRLDGPDTNTAADWAAQAEPGPGKPSVLITPTPTATITPTATPTGGTSTPTATATTAMPTPTATPLPGEALAIALNEILPDPANTDWDRDGETSFMDEWIELHNVSTLPVSLAGWTVGDDTATYTLPAGTVIYGRGFLLLYRSQTHLSLGDWRDAVTLTRSDGTLADRLTYERGPGDDKSFCRLPDGSGGWTGDCAASPGEANRGAPPPPPVPTGNAAPTATTAKSAAPQTVRAARAAAVDTRVTLSGSVTFPPGLIASTVYMQDDTGGIKVYLRKGEFPALKVGDQIKVTGWTRDFHGEAEVSVSDASYLRVTGPGTPPVARVITAQEIGEGCEGELVQVVGAVTKFAPRGLTLKDKTGQMELYFPESLPWQRPYVHIGELWAAQGVLSQYQSERGEGYRIIPRFKSDVTDAPLGLPVTGAGDGGL